MPFFSGRVDSDDDSSSKSSSEFINLKEINKDRFIKGRILAIVNIIAYLIEVIFIIFLLISNCFKSETPLSLEPKYIQGIWIVILLLQGAFTLSPLIFNASDFYDIITDKIGINFALI